jgi:hypothetical protein
MAKDNPIYVDDVGTTFRITVVECIDGADVVVDVSGQSAMDFFFKKPDDTVMQVTPVFTDDGVDGEIEYVTQAAEINLKGVWSLQAEVTLPSGTFRTSIVTFNVKSKLA